jgi:hypothetical protein
MGAVRPTLRTLREDLQIPLPPAPDPLDEIPHPVLAKAHEQFTAPDRPHERIRAIDDTVLFKVKSGRWRGAIWQDSGSEVPAWLVAAGVREDGSREDFYAALATATRSAKARYNSTHSTALITDTYSGPWLPTPDDLERYELEAGARLERRLAAAVHHLIHSALEDGAEHAALLDGIALGIQILVRSEHETYVSIRIIGSVPTNITALILSAVPGCDPTGWGPEYAMPDRPIAPAEQVWSNLIDPDQAAKIVQAG